MQQLKIGIIGDFNFTFNTHHATNLALEHAANFLELDLSYYWIRANEVSSMKAQQLSNYDGFWLAPGPFVNPFYLKGIVDLLLQLELPVFITGEAYKTLIEVLAIRNNLNVSGEKFISDNLVEGNHFEHIAIIPHTKTVIHLYENRSNEELTANRYSLYPNLMESLQLTDIDVEAYNQYEEPEIISLKNKNFFVACGFCPQITSTRELPHPLVYTFVKATMI
jgi:CTP synthase (UTP-ammonia lyase)